MDSFWDDLRKKYRRPTSQTASRAIDRTQNKNAPGGPSIKRLWNETAFDDAPWFKPIGPYEDLRNAAETFARLGNTGSLWAPLFDEPAIQDKLAEKLSANMAHAYLAYGFGSNGQAYYDGMQDFYTRGRQLAGEARRAAYAAPVDISDILSTPYNRRQTIGEAFPQLRGIRKGGDIFGLLLSSAAPGIKEFVAREHLAGRDTLEAFSAGLFGATEALGGYVKNFRGNMPVVEYMLRGARNAITGLIQSDYRAGGKWSLEGQNVEFVRAQPLPDGGFDSPPVAPAEIAAADYRVDRYLDQLASQRYETDGLRFAPQKAPFVDYYTPAGQAGVHPEKRFSGLAFLRLLEEAREGADYDPSAVRLARQAARDLADWAESGEPMIWTQEGQDFELRGRYNPVPAHVAQQKSAPTPVYKLMDRMSVRQLPTQYWTDHPEGRIYSIDHYERTGTPVYDYTRLSVTKTAETPYQVILRREDYGYHQMLPRYPGGDGYEAFAQRAAVAKKIFGSAYRLLGVVGEDRPAPPEERNLDDDRRYGGELRRETDLKFERPIRVLMPANPSPADLQRDERQYNQAAAPLLERDQQAFAARLARAMMRSERDKGLSLEQAYEAEIAQENIERINARNRVGHSDAEQVRLSDVISPEEQARQDRLRQQLGTGGKFVIGKNPGIVHENKPVIRPTKVYAPPPPEDPPPSAYIRKPAQRKPPLGKHKAFLGDDPFADDPFLSPRERALDQRRRAVEEATGQYSPSEKASYQETGGGLARPHGIATPQAHHRMPIFDDPVSTDIDMDPESSRARRLARSAQVVEGGGGTSYRQLQALGPSGGGSGEERDINPNADLDFARTAAQGYDRWAGVQRVQGGEVSPLAFSENVRMVMDVLAASPSQDPAFIEQALRRSFPGLSDAQYQSMVQNVADYRASGNQIDPQSKRMFRSVARGRADAAAAQGRVYTPLSARRAAEVTRAAASNITPRSVLAFRSDVIGEGVYDDVTGASVVRPDGSVSLDAEAVGTAVQVAQRSVAGAGAQALPGNLEDAIATLRTNAYAQVAEEIKAVGKRLRDQGVSESEIATRAANIGNVARVMTENALKHAEQVVAEEFGQANAPNVHERQYRGAPITTRAQARSLAESSPSLAAEFARRNSGLSLEEAAVRGRGQAISFTYDGQSYMVGGGFGGEGREGWTEGSNWFSNKWNRMLYGMYMMQRAASMTVQPVLQAAQAYARPAYALGVAAAYGTGETSWETGIMARQGIAELAGQKAAYEVAGWTQEIPYFLSRTPGGESLNRLAHYGRAAAGIATGGMAVAATGLFLTPTIGAVGRTMSQFGTAGLIAGGALLTAGVLLELGNHTIWKDDPITPQGIWDDVQIHYSESMARVARDRSFGFLPIGPYDQSRLLTNFGPGWGQHLGLGQRGVPGYPGGGMSVFSDGQVVDFDDPAWYMKKFASDAEYHAWQKKQQEGSFNEKRLADLTTAWSEALDIEPGKALGFASAIDQIFGDLTGDKDFQEKLAKNIKATGQDPLEMLAEAESFASSFGLSFGTAAYSREVGRYLNMDVASQRTASTRAQRRNELGQQLQTLMPNTAGYYKLGLKTVTSSNIQSQMDVGKLLTLASAAQSGGYELTPHEWEKLGRIAWGMTAPTAAFYGQIGQEVASLGGSAMQVFGNATQLSNYQISVGGAVMSGGLQAASYQSWVNGNNLDARLFDPAGRPWEQTNGTAYYLGLRRNLSGVDTLNLGGYARGWALGDLKFGSLRQFSSSLLETQNPEILKAFETQGLMGLQLLGSQQAYEAQMASIGLQAQGVRLNQQFYWGSGSWDAPAPGSMWALENQQLALQRRSQTADFAAQEWQMQTSNRYAIERELGQAERMALSQRYNLYNLDFSRMQSLQSQGWAREDWGYQDTTRQLNFGWQMEDLDEAIRFSSGRERRSLIRQKERAALSYNLEGDQIDRQRERQEQLWAQEDERFNQQKNYTLELQRLDRESFELNKRQREEGYAFETEQFRRRKDEWAEAAAIEDEMRQLQRSHQAEMLSLSLAQAGASATAAAQQKELNDALAKATPKMEALSGSIEQINRYDQAYRTVLAMKSMIGAVDTVSIARIDAIIRLAKELGGKVSQTKINLDPNLDPNNIIVELER